MLAWLARPVAAIAGAIAVSIGLSELRFVDRKTAGDILAEILWQAIPANHRGNVIVLGIPRGGVIIAKQVSARFSAELGLVVAKKILAPGSDEEAIGALVAGQPEYFNDFVLNESEAKTEEVSNSIANAKEEVAFRNQLYFAESEFPTIRGKTVILVDDGAATGSTLVASARFIRKQDPAMLVVAVPIATKVAMVRLEHEAEKVVTVIEAKGSFRTVGQFYKSFVPILHEDVLKVIRSAKTPPR
jgi:putative phosphoribosyl transferase